jgi:hypothetical protein
VGIRVDPAWIDIAQRVTADLQAEASQAIQPPSIPP